MTALETVEHETEDQGEAREIYLRDGRRLTISETGADQLVEIRGEGGLVEVRIRLTEQGPVLQMESVRMSLTASESLEIAAPHVAITGTDIAVEAENKVDVEAKQGDVRVVGKKIWLN